MATPNYKKNYSIGNFVGIKWISSSAHWEEFMKGEYIIIIIRIIVDLTNQGFSENRFK
jgi:uncharacterized protein YkwD